MGIEQGASSYRLDENWPKYPPDMQFEMGSGVTVDDDGIVYLFTRDIEHWAAHPLAMGAKMGKSSVSMFDRAGNSLGKWGESDKRGFALTAHTIYFIDGALWTVDREGHTIRKCDKSGNILLTLGTFGEWGDGPKHFNGPTGVTALRDGTIVVSDGYWNSRLIWFSPEGEYIKEIGGWGTEPGQFTSPHAIAVTPDDRLLVVDVAGGALHSYATEDGQIAEHRKQNDPNRTKRIQVFDSEGRFLEQHTHVKPTSIAVYGDRIYVSDGGRDLAVLDVSTFEEVDRFKSPALSIHQMAMDAHGDLYTATVYPERFGELRGAAGPSHRHWICPGQ
jgi:DNA-binding beta-propeller fold protein YncE